jgi:hypothetical protein
MADQLVDDALVALQPRGNGNVRLVTIDDPLQALGHGQVRLEEAQPKALDRLPRAGELRLRDGAICVESSLPQDQTGSIRLRVRDRLGGHGRNSGSLPGSACLPRHGAGRGVETSPRRAKTPPTRPRTRPGNPAEPTQNQPGPGSGDDGGTGPLERGLRLTCVDPRLAETARSTEAPRFSFWRGIGSAQRRGRDSNPRWTERPTTVFETAPFNRSGTPPRNHDHRSGRRRCPDPARTAPRRISRGASRGERDRWGTIGERAC